jgi:hypothetical protein
MSVEIFCTSNAGAERTNTRVGSSSPATSGSAWPLTFGSSLTATFVAPLKQVGLVRDERTVLDARRELQIELHLDRAERRHVDVANVEDAGAVRAAGRARARRVRAGR